MPKVAGSGHATVLTPKQSDLIIDVAPSPDHREIWSIQRFVGSQIQETLFLSWNSIHEERISFQKKITKTKETREPLMDPRLNNN